MAGGSLVFHCHLFKCSIKRRNVLRVKKWDAVKDRKMCERERRRKEQKLNEAKKISMKAHRNK